MVESGTRRTFKIQLSAEALKAGLDQSLYEAIDSFEPLRFDAASDAIKWLRAHVANPQEPFVTVLEIDADDNHLIGFFVLRYIPLQLISNPAVNHLAAEVGWIARSAVTDGGYGESLFHYAVTMCVDEDMVGIVVDPYDDATARKIWIERFQFEPVDAEDQVPHSPDWLWYPIVYPEGSRNGANGASPQSQ